MLRKLSIENFKAVGPRVDIELKPVTLLFGPNSAGKSTIIHAIHYAHAILETGDPDVGKTRLGGGLDLGGFATLVHGHHRHGNERSIVLDFEFEPDEELAEHFDRIFSLSGITLQWAGQFKQGGEKQEVPEDFNTFEERSREQRQEWLGQIERVGVALNITYSPLQRRPIVEQFSLSINGRVLAELHASVDGAQVSMTNIDQHHPNHPEYDPESVEEDVDPIDTSDWWCLRGRKMALPWLDRDLGFDALELEELYISFIGALLVAAARSLRDELSAFRYVGPIRQAPERGFRPPVTTKNARWANGMGAWDALYYDEKLRERTSEWLSLPARLDTGYRLVKEPRYVIDAATRNRIVQGLIDADEIKIQESQDRLALFSEHQAIELEVCDVGEGLSQVIPIVAASLDRTLRDANGLDQSIKLVALEQPELHIHPRMQVVLGDLFLFECREKQFIVETHSEHIMLRLLKRIRETAEGELGPDAPEATTDMVNVLYVNLEEGAVKITPLRISEDGDFKDQWPDGFFHERLDELT